MNTFNRRTFLGTAAMGAAAVTTLGQAAENKPKLKMGLIGAGWYGMVDVKAAFRVGGVEITAVCDVDEKHLNDSADAIEKLQGYRPKTFKSYEELLETPGLEAVIIATPPHWHALNLIAALEKGLDVYCEKPLAYDIREGRAMVQAARNQGRIIQVGFQRRQSPAIQQVRDYVQSGKAGNIVQAEAQIHYQAGMRDATPQNPPAELDWNMWCGPAPVLPYSPQVGHFSWRLEKEYGNGHLVDWGIHLIDATRWILGESMPKSVQAAGGLYYFKDNITTPDILTAHFDFESCPVTWRHHMWGAAEYSPDVKNGIFLYGEKATVFVTDSKWIVIPRKKGEARQEFEAKADMAANHMADFLKCVQTRQKPLCMIEDAYQSTATVQLAMLAYESGAKLNWNRETEAILNNPVAARLARREYRSPWKHPYQG